MRPPAPATIAIESRTEPIAATPRPVVARLLDVTGRVLATFADTPQREHDRQAALDRWHAERDLVANEWQDAGPGSARQQDADALLQYIDAILAELEHGMIATTRLSTLERSLAAFRQAPLAALARRGAPFVDHGRRPRHEPWHAIVAAEARKRPRASFQQIVDRLIALSEVDHAVFHEFVGTDRDREACRAVIGCSQGPHFHWRRPNEPRRPKPKPARGRRRKPRKPRARREGDRLYPLSTKRIHNYLMEHHLIAPRRPPRRPR